MNWEKADSEWDIPNSTFFVAHPFNFTRKSHTRKKIIENFSFSYFHDSIVCHLFKLKLYTILAHLFLIFEVWSVPSFHNLLWWRWCHSFLRRCFSFDFFFLFLWFALSIFYLVESVSPGWIWRSYVVCHLTRIHTNFLDCRKRLI